jgi:hypothetical protein
MPIQISAMSIGYLIEFYLGINALAKADIIEAFKPLPLNRAR